MTLAWVRAALRRLRGERTAAIGLAGLVLVTGFLFGIAPRALDATGDEVMRDEVRRAGLFERNIQFIEFARLRPARADNPTRRIDELGVELTDRLPAAVRALIADGSWIADSARHALQDRPNPMFVRFRFMDGIDDRIRYVAGTAPGPDVGELDGVTVNGERFDDVAVFEVAIARRTAQVFGLAVGDTVAVVGDQSDPLLGRRQFLQVLAIEVTGTYEVNDPADPWWMGERLAIEPVVRTLGPNVDIRYLDGAVILSPDAYTAFDDATADLLSPLQYTWRRFVDPDRLDAATAGSLIVELRRAQAAFPSTSPTPSLETGYRTGLLNLLESQQARWQSAVSILTVVATGPAVVAAAALALVVLLTSARRRSALGLSRSRGASLAQLTGAVLVEAILLVVPAVALAVLLARLAIPGGPNSPTTIAAVAVALVVITILVATSVPAASSAADGRAAGGRDTGIVRRPSTRRIVLEAGLVTVAVAGAWLLRERSVHGTSTAGRLEAADPLIAAVPVLVGLAAGIVALRVLPLPMRLLAWLAAARRDLVPVLAMRRATSGAGVGPVLVVLLATATIGAFSSVALVHLERAAETVAWQEIGAAYRITPGGGPLPGTLDPATLPGAEAAAMVYRTSVPVGLGGPRLELLVLDPAAFDSVVRGTPAESALPAEMAAPPGSAIPAIVARSLGERPDGVDAGEAFQLSVEGYTLPYVAVDVRDSFPGVPAGSHFAVVSRAHFAAFAPTARLDPTVALVRARDDAADALRLAALSIVEGGLVESRAERTAALRGSPVTGAVRLGIAAAIGVAALYALLAVAAAMALAGVARAVEIAHLRTLGLTRREALGLVVVEHGPTVGAAFAAGLGLGVGLFLLLRPGLGLSALVGSPTDVPLAVEAGQLALVLAAVVAIVGLGLAGAAVLQRAAAPAAAIRRGFE